MFQAAEDLFKLRFGLFDAAADGLAVFLALPGGLIFQVGPGGGEAGFVLLEGQALVCKFPALAGQLLLGALELRQDPAGLQVVLAQVPFGFVQDLQGQSPLPGNLEGVAGAGDTVGEAEEGFFGVFVEEGRDILAARFHLGKGLDLVKVVVTAP
jgi:hypothetical protein